MKTEYSQIASNMRACGIREDWCAAVEAADGFHDALEWLLPYAVDLAQYARPDSTADAKLHECYAVLAKAKGA